MFSRFFLALFFLLAAAVMSSGGAYAQETQASRSTADGAALLDLEKAIEVEPLAGRRPAARPPKAAKPRTVRPKATAPGKKAKPVKLKSAKAPGKKVKAVPGKKSGVKKASKPKSAIPGKKAKSATQNKSKAETKKYKKPKTVTSTTKLPPGKKSKTKFQGKEGIPRKIDWGNQGKHVPGHNNSMARKSQLNKKLDAQKLLDGVHSGTYKVVAHDKRNNHPIADFKKPIATNRDGTTTRYGKLHIGKKGVHIVPYFGPVGG